MIILKISLPGGHRPPGLWEAVEPGGKPGSCFAGEGPPSWQQQAGCKPHLAADIFHRQYFRALHSGVFFKSFRALHSGGFFSSLIRMGGGFASASQSPREPLAQRQDASFRQRRLVLGTAGPPGQDETALPSVNEPPVPMLLFIFIFPVHSAQQCRPALYQLPLMR